MNTKSMRSLPLACLLLGAAGCVSNATYEDAVAKRAQVDAALVIERQRAASARADLAEIEAQQTKLEVALAGKRVGSAVLAAKLWITRAERDYLARAHLATERRAAAARETAARLQRMIDTGDVQVTIRDGRMVILLPNDVLFDSGKVDIKPRGRESLAQVAGALRSLPGRHLQVAGHTDNVPISSARFASNWELSSARGVEVVRFLLKQGVEPGALSAAGYSEFDPIGSNETTDGRAKNRRIEITLMPELEDPPPADAASPR
jgi:chemotaxis protein MotB